VRCIETRGYNAMKPVRVLLRIYYERLHERMAANRARLIARIDPLLSAEIARQGFGPMRPDQVQAYREAALAFIDERLETYNPIGIQYTFDRAPSQQAAELEFQFDWYNSRAEFEELVVAARGLADEEDTPDEHLGDLADKLIRQVGAFPDRSIIAGYVEQVICRSEPEGP
jgi:hypothetical protein